jgi:hypothetical protein
MRERLWKTLSLALLRKRRNHSQNSGALTNSCLYSMAFAMPKPLFKATS